MFRVTDTMWPGVVVLPTMSTGATDGRSLRAAGIPTSVSMLPVTGAVTSVTVAEADRVGSTTLLAVTVTVC